MLTLSPLSNTNGESKNETVQNFFVAVGVDDSFPDFSGESLLSSIDFDDLFVSINDRDHVLPDLEMDSEILAEFSSVSGDEETETNASLVSAERLEDDNDNPRNKDEHDKVSGCNDGTSRSKSNQGEEIVSKRDESSVVSPCPKESADTKGRKSSAQSKNPPRRKKVDWTPELHRRFVQAVEQLGVDKAVPSRILELMGIDFLTRHNIASHLQKYRSHRKHMLAREAETASWNQRRQMYGSTSTAGGGNEIDHRSPWLAPTIGFPPVAPSHHFTPLHVWGHPSMNRSLVNMWPKHLVPSPAPPRVWPTAPPPSHPPAPLTDHNSFWHSQHHQRVPSSFLTPGTPCFQQPLAATRFPSPPVPGIPPPVSYIVQTAPTGQTTYPNPPFDLHPSKESIDAAIGDVLSKRWLPLPLGLKQPAVDGVLVELQRQGISKVPPTSSCS